VSRNPTLHASLILMLAAGLTLGCTHPGEQAAAFPVKREVAKRLEDPPRGPFGYSLVATQTGAPLEVDDFAPFGDCADCHERQWEEMEGSIHTIAHTDPLYRSTAELARRQAGEEIYTYCSGCHAPQGVTTGLIPSTPEAELPDVVKAGILCDVCHQVSQLTGTAGPWGEPGNASLVLSPDSDRKFGPPGGDDAAADHGVETRDFLDRSEFCASCHTIIHPLNGLRLEHTYGEWKKSIYAEKGIQCQDCHMRSVADAVKVAETLAPVAVLGRSEPSGAERAIHPHEFVGANANLEVLGGNPSHASMAEARLKSSARLEIEAPSAVRAGDGLEFDVVVHNVAAGHSLPTSLTELREMWVALEVRAEDDRLLFQSGRLESDGEIPEGAMRFGAIAGDAEGNVTYKPWEVSQFLWKRLIPARGSARDSFRVDLPRGFSGPAQISAKLFYRSASPRALASLMGDEAFEPKQVEMTSAEAAVAVRQ